MPSSGDRKGFGENPSVAEFLAELERTPWFENIGKRIPSNPDVQRVAHWDNCPGPQDPLSEEISDRLEALNDELIAASGKQRRVLSKLSKHIEAIVIRGASRKVPYDPKQDSYHRPTLAVWHATWVAGLMGECLYLGRTPPADLQEQWKWFVAGHWPCGWSGDFPEGKMVVY